MHAVDSDCAVQLNPFQIKDEADCTGRGNKFSFEAIQPLDLCGQALFYRASILPLCPWRTGAWLCLEQEENTNRDASGTQLCSCHSLQPLLSVKRLQIGKYPGTHT